MLGTSMEGTGMLFTDMAGPRSAGIGMRIVGRITKIQGNNPSRLMHHPKSRTQQRKNEKR